MNARVKYLLWVFGGVAVVGGMVAEQKRPAPDPAAVDRGALALSVAKTIRSAANDPDSVEFVSMDVNAGATIACAEYRGKNSFNAKVKQSTVFVNGMGHTGNTKLWNKHCSGEMFSQMPLAR